MFRTDRPRHTASAWITGTLLLFALAGCGGVKLYPVHGKITYADGTPMPGEGQITFNAIDKDAKHSARGIIHADGTFKMGTFGDTDGVPAGKYRVAIQPTPPHNPNRPPAGWPPLAKKYMNPAKSGLEYEVTTGKNEYNVVVEK